MINIVLQSKKVKPIWHGHPWVFPKAIQTMDATPNTAELVKILDAKNQVIGVGVYNPHSIYRVRMLAYEHETFAQNTLDAIIEHRLNTALNLRKNLNLPNPSTNAYRLFNSEGDGLSGLVIDVYDTIAVVSSSAYWVEHHRTLIESCIKHCLKNVDILWRSQHKALKQDGFEPASDSKTQTDITRTIHENNMTYELSFQQTQKTGLFLDQRDNHQIIAALAPGKNVLDLYCYVGGFALHAAKAGAQKVTAVDSSADAIRLAQHHAEINNLSIDFICADVNAYLSRAGEYDIIILDPPKLAPSRQHLHKATKLYRYLHEQVFRAMKKNTLLFTCNCSSAMTWDLFSDMLRDAATASQKRIQCLGKYGAAPDHPTLPAFPEGEYLRAMLLNVS